MRHSRPFRSTRDFNSERLYYEQVSRTSLLSPEEEYRLACLVRQGDCEARDRLIRANLRLVIKIAREKAGKGLSIGELIGEGNLGLIHAAEQFDPEKKTRFSTYARFWIVQSINRALLDANRAIHLPAYVFDLINKWRAVYSEIETQTGSVPSPEAVLDSMNLSPHKRAILWHALFVRSALEAPESGEPSADPTALADHRTSAVSDQLIDAELRQQALAAVAALPEEERELIVLSFGLNDQESLNESQIARKLGSSRQRVRAGLRRALRALKRTCTA